MNKETFTRLELVTQTFQHTSFKYLGYEDIKDYNLVLETQEIILIYGTDQESKLSEIIYACNDFEIFRKNLETYNEVLVKFIPKEWHEKLKELGYIDYAILRDYWLDNLSEFNKKHPNVTFATIKDAKSISDITKENAGASRAFHGDSVDFISSWIDGSNTTLIDLKAKNNQVYTYKTDNQILGIALTCIYANYSPKGPVLWLREIAIKKGYHGQGIGRRIILSALSEGLRNGARRSFLITDDLNLNAKYLYESIGFKPKMDEQQIDMISPNF